MPSDLLERPDSSTDDDSGVSQQPSDGLEQNWAADNSGYNSADPTSKAKSATSPKAFDGDALQNQEANAAPGGGFAPKLMNEANLSGQALGAAMNTVPMGRFARAAFVIKNNKGKSAGIGGIIITVIVMGIAFFASGLEAINTKENYVGRGNLAGNYSLRLRNARSLSRMLLKFNPNVLQNNVAATLSNLDAIDSKKFLGRLEKQGFLVDTDADGAITKISRELEGGVTQSIDFLADNVDDQVSNFTKNLTNSELRALDKVAASSTTRWSGPAGRALVRNQLKSAFKSILDSIKTDPTKTEADNIAAAGDVAQQPQTASELELGTRGADVETDPSGQQIDPETKQPVTVNDIDGPLKEAGEIPTETSQQASKAVAAVTAETVDDTARSLQSISSGILASSATQNLLTSLNYLGIVQMGCSAIGTVQFIASMRNLLFTIEVARFAYRYLSAADTQKSGLITGQGFNMYMKFMHSGGGKAYTSAPGLLYATGDKSQVVSEEGRSAYSVGRENAGAFGVIDNFFNSLPGFATDVRTATCKTVNNGWVVAGTLAVSVGITIVTLGTGQAIALGVSDAAKLGIQAGLQLALVVGGPMLAQAGKHALFNEVSSQLKGEGLGAGLGALSSMNGSTSGMLLTPKSVSVALNAAAEADYKETMKSASFTERYLSLTNGDSLLSRLAMAAPSKTQALASGSFFMNNNPLRMDTMSAVLSYLGGGRTYAYSNQCTDPQLQNYATDPFCSPEVTIAPDLDIQETYDLLLANGDISADGTPVSEAYKNFMTRCASGAPSLVYNTNVKKDGSDQTYIDDCTSDATALHGETVPATQAYAYIYDNQPKQSFFAKLFGKRVYAAPEDNRLVSRRERYAAWNGFRVDKANLVDDITGGTPLANAAKGNNAIAVIGDSLTVGMQKLDTSGNYLGQALSARGWAPNINAQGCRGVYQPQGPITGDGKSCPTPAVAGGPIIDAVTLVNDPAVAAQYASAGTFVIALGTNGYETDVTQFSEKAQEVISKIKSLSPNAKIYWLNIRLKTNGQKQNDYNAAIADIANKNGVEVMDWDKYVTKVGSDLDDTNDVTWPATDTTHNDANGYKKKVDFVTGILGQAPSIDGTASGGGNLNCDSYNEIGSSPSIVLKRVYPEAIRTACAQLKQQCVQGVSDTQKILCAAFDFDGVYYGNGYGTYSGSKANAIYGFSATSNNYGLRPASWLANRSSGLTPNNLLECSGLAAVALYKAYNFTSTSLYCSGQFTNKQNPKLFQQLTAGEVKAGDYVTESFGCNNGGTGHIAIAATTPDADGNFIVYETNAWKKPVRFTQRNIYKDFNGGWSRFIVQ